MPGRRASTNSCDVRSEGVTIETRNAHLQKQFSKNPVSLLSEYSGEYHSDAI